ncbi:GGDEF domain-containing protein [Pseudoalteromonas sp. CO348]|uniref:GGDEF domain-containing protein n=1 Tax=unclassified Pseudoalteromonas TaxID=194690 RepID=UPI001022FBB6|nr:GGDEF domain-containing protein [Pseudoalteromonas sp. CO348]MCG7539419.1 diguanylate cyclase [Pseudoalteromonas sp. OF7H-1]RZF99262.1 GGDEF domain-containing protein [Pseudoalteromonas sp. CO348]
MTDNAVMLEQKLKQAIEARKTLEDARKQQVELLTQFAAKLSLACKGQDVSLDNQLAKFRIALNKGVDFELLVPFIDGISEPLKSQEVTNSNNQKALQTAIQQSGKLLQKLKGLPDESRRKLRHLLDVELEDINSTNAYIPALESLVSIYHTVLQSKVEITEETSHSHYPELAAELQALINELIFEDEVIEKVKEIRASVAENNSLDNLYSAATEIIKIIAQTIAKERQSAQGFLVSLNQTLEELHRSIVETTARSKSTSKELQSLNNKIELKIQNLNQQTQNASSITELKALVDNELKLLSADLIERERLEKNEREALLDSFDAINNRINTLESKVSNYKKRLSEQKFKSLLDSLTKLPNRAAFDERLTHEMHLFEINDSDVTLVVIDVDHFKSINDRYGHSAGDKTLQVIARALKKSIRKSDFIARYGGEEFVLLMPGMPLTHAQKPLEKVRQVIKSIPFKFKEKEVEITISLGATQFVKGDTALSAFDRADAALYEAKNSGRDRLCFK